MKFCPDFSTNSRKEWRVSLFQSNLRKQIRKLPKTLKSVKIIHYDSLLFICVLGRDERGGARLLRLRRGARRGPRAHLPDPHGALRPRRCPDSPRQLGCKWGVYVLVILAKNGQTLENFLQKVGHILRNLRLNFAKIFVKTSANMETFGQHLANLIELVTFAF